MWEASPDADFSVGATAPPFPVIVFSIRRGERRRSRHGGGLFALFVSSLSVLFSSFFYPTLVEGFRALALSFLPHFPACG